MEFTPSVRTNLSTEQLRHKSAVCCILPTMHELLQNDQQNALLKVSEHVTMLFFLIICFPVVGNKCFDIQQLPGKYNVNALKVSYKKKTCLLFKHCFKVKMCTDHRLVSCTA